MHGRRANTSLAEIHKEMSELFDKQVNAQKEKLLGFTQAPASPQKVCDENERNKQNNHACKNVIDGRKPFIRRI